MILRYPAIGSRWWVKTGPSIEPFVVEVIGAGHGDVALKDINSTHRFRVEITLWMKRLLQQEPA